MLFFIYKLILQVTSLRATQWLLGLYDRDYMREPQKESPPPFRKPPTIVIVGGILALVAFGFVVFGR